MDCDAEGVFTVFVFSTIGSAQFLFLFGTIDTDPDALSFAALFHESGPTVMRGRWLEGTFGWKCFSVLFTAVSGGLW